MLTSSFSMQEKRKLYMKDYHEHRDEIDARIASGIEQNRKGDCHIQFISLSGQSVGGKKVKITQKAHDFKHGANIFMLDGFERETDNTAYRQIFKEYFNLATIPFYWSDIEPEKGKPRYAADSPKVYRRPAPDLCMQYCEENNVAAKLHCLVYEKFLPKWLLHMSLEEVKAKYEERMRQIAERYAGRMYEIEVINEVTCEHEWTEKTLLSEEKDIVKWAFETARKYFPENKLVINDGHHIVMAAETDYRNPYYMMIENALLKGSPIQKIGIQNHIFTGTGSKNTVQYDESIKHFAPWASPVIHFKGLDIFQTLGLPVEYTEVTIPTFGDTMEDEELQADMLRLLYSVWFCHPAVDAIVYWNLVDGHAYASEAFNENNCRGGLFHHDLTPKKSAAMLKKLFNEIWHTDLELIADENGCVDFRGFYGDYSIEIDGKVYELGFHKQEERGNDYEKCIL